MTLPGWNFGPYRLEPTGARLTRGEKTLPLRPKAFAVLCHLVERSGRLVGKDEVLYAVWPRGYVSDSVVEVCINQLRKALEDDSRSPRYIETVPKRGYRFIAEVAVRCAESDETTTAVTSHAHTAPPDAERWAGRKGALAGSTASGPRRSPANGRFSFSPARQVSARPHSSTQTPLVLVLEDLHWSDNATPELLSLLGRRRGRAALLVIGSYRAGDAALREHPVKQVQQELASHRLCAELALDT
jgi:DNA-binding winged helix-turn-helix (wHTH) protein